MVLVRIGPPFEANTYCNLVLKWPLNKAMSSFMIYKQANVSRYLRCLLWICMINMLILFMLQLMPNLLFHFTSKAYANCLHLGFLSQPLWLSTIGDPFKCWSEPERNGCLSLPFLFMAASSEASFISLSLIFLICKLSKTINTTRFLS